MIGMQSIATETNAALVNLDTAATSVSATQSKNGPVPKYVHAVWLCVRSARRYVHPVATLLSPTD